MFWREYRILGVNYWQMGKNFFDFCFFWWTPIFTETNWGFTSTSWPVTCYVNAHISFNAYHRIDPQWAFKTSKFYHTSCSCFLSEIFRFIVPNINYSDETVHDIFRLIISSFASLTSKNTKLYAKELGYLRLCLMWGIALLCWI